MASYVGLRVCVHIIGNSIPVEIDGKVFQLQLGVTVFNSVQERLAAEQ
jgi:hypothetical protein